MDFEAVERHNLELRRNGHFDAAYVELDQLVVQHESDPVATALLLFLRALTLFRDAPRNLHTAIELTERILPVLVSHPVAHVKALLNGVAYADLASDEPRVRDWSWRLKVLCKSEQVRQWMGQSLLRLALSAVKRGDHVSALECTERALVYYQDHRGPHQPEDRSRMVALAHCLRGEAFLGLGKLESAQLCLHEARRTILAGRKTYDADYLEALIAKLLGDDDRVGRLLQRAFHEAEQARDHEYRLRAGEEYARHAIKVGEQELCHQVLGPMIRVAAEFRNIPVLVRLQRLSASTV